MTEKGITSRRPDAGWSEPLWEPQAGEGTKAFATFAEYRDLGPVRSVSIVSDRLHKSVSLCNRWCGEWGWVERVAAWDLEQDRITRAMAATDRANELREMRAGHASLGKALTSVAALGLEKFTGPQGKANVQALTAAELARLVEIGTKVELRARGETTERVEVQAARAALEPFLDLALSYLPVSAQEAFLLDVDEKLGVGGADAA